MAEFWRSVVEEVYRLLESAQMLYQWQVLSSNHSSYQTHNIIGKLGFQSLSDFKKLKSENFRFYFALSVSLMTGVLQP